VAFRPLRGEILYSWLARTAGIYDLAPGDLLAPEKDGLLDVLVNGHGASAFKHLGVLTCMPKAALLRMTLRGIRPKWPEHWCIAGPRLGSTPGDQLIPYLQVCPECLTSDIKEESGTQFLRMRWQSAAVTICSKHRMPLQQTCVMCRHTDWPISSRIGVRRYGFVCRRCGSPQDQSKWRSDQSDDYSISLLARFEQQIVRALSNRAVYWSWVGHAEPGEFIRLIEDLLWALTLSCRQSRPIYKLQTLSFPLGERYLPVFSRDRWHTAPPHVRRCLLAAVLAIIGSAQARALLDGSGTYASRWCELLDCLDTKALAELERRSWLWPPAIHNALRRARGKSPRPRSVAAFSTELGKTRSTVKHFY
jgi:hypothetical protein